MRNSIAHARRNAVRIVIFQLGIAALAGLGFCAQGWRSGAAAGYGGGAIAVGNALFAWRLYADGIAPTRRIARAVYVAEVAKWAWLMLALYAAFALLGLAPLPLVVGVVAAQLGFWVAVGFVR